MHTKKQNRQLTPVSNPPSMKVDVPDREKRFKRIFREWVPAGIEKAGKVSFHNEREESMWASVRVQPG